MPACKVADYLPKFDAAHLSPYGSHIRLKTINHKRVEGELIEVNDKTLIILNSNQQLTEHFTKDVKSYRVYFIQPPDYSVPLTILNLLPLSHGIFIGLTFPVTLVNTLIISSSLDYTYVFTNKDVPIDELYKFARFPQGMPDDIEFDRIKRYSPKK
jgi:hypothetical protein